MTSGRLKATACATAYEPSHCLSMVSLRQFFLFHDDLKGLAGSGHVALRDATVKLLLDCCLHGFQGDEAAQGGKCTEQRYIGHGAVHVFHGQFGGRNRQQMLGPKVLDEPVSYTHLTLPTIYSV